ncbi:NmrA family NAD(P)-binding protein [Actinomycetospora sp. TBRC 11914]|uniref:NmrA family NAD(P)-binding protein n=1 Tax=Actinomycetospora sp. TBRC 11914 TaxID=2729387 RepID=UPI00145DBE6A|nr:NmrA family NAD(P)-binding protein [Actinomycetospora sp. TBRC 11914]NMO91520.1 NmrA family NAD(P)-binding protein [Actinomycetospora sp. TBRC 11914]
MAGFVLVTGATGQQGGATARALLTAGTPVHALVRDPDAPRAKDLATLGATLVVGNLDDPDSLARAAAGARGVFSVQTPDLADLMGDAELRHAQNLAAAARTAGVAQVVHTSVSGAARSEPIDEARWGAFMGHYWRSKAAAEEAARDAGAASTTILRPSTFMENFVRPSFYFADGTSDHLLVAMDLDVAQPFVAVADIGAAAAAAFADPVRFDGVELELAGDLLTFRQAAAVLSEVLGTTITVPQSPAQARADGLPDHFAVSQQLMSEHPAPARPGDARALGLPTTSFASWASATLGAAASSV